jgi:peroxiredoxin
MNNKFKYLLFLLLAAILALFLYKKFRVAPSVKFEELHLQNLDGEKIEFGSFTGKKLIVSFGASWCINCIDELNTLKKIKDKELSDVEIIVISDESLDRIAAFRAKKEYPVTFLKMDSEFAAIGIHSIPTTYIFNTKLELKKEEVGYIAWEDTSTLEHLKKLME